MTSVHPTSSDETSTPYEVGYGKPPRHTQFRKGLSGNPGGRPRRPPTARLDHLVLHEVYRLTFERLHEGGPLDPMPVIQSIIRSQLNLARNGNARAQRDVLKMVRDIERSRIESGYAVDEPDDDDLDNEDLDCDAADGDVDDSDVQEDAADGEPARQQDGIAMNGDGRPKEPDRTASPAVSAPQLENAAASPETGGHCPEERRRPAAVSAETLPGAAGVRDPRAVPRRRPAAAPAKRSRRSRGRTGTGPDKTGPGKTGPGKTGTGKTGPGKTGPDKIRPGGPAQAAGGRAACPPASLSDRRKS